MDYENDVEDNVEHPVVVNEDDVCDEVNSIMINNYL